MKILQNLEISNFKNISHSVFKDFNHVNVFIGPNNSGKSNLLLAINKISTIDASRPHNNITCETCKEIFQQTVGKSSISSFGYSWSLSKQDYFEGNSKPTVIFSLNSEYLTQDDNYKQSISNLSPIIGPHLKFLEQTGVNANTELREKLIKHVEDECTNKICMVADGPWFRHLTIISPQLLQSLTKTILHCPEERLQTYKEKAISTYVKEKDMDAEQLKDAQNRVRDIVDSELLTYTSTSLNYLRGPRRFSTPIQEQGSGVRSLICLISDIVSAKEQIILIDEPELGLNPAAKRKLINFLKESTIDKQFFIATHDPEFVNPKLWGNEVLSIYLYSITKNQFVKVCLESSQDPNTFGGYLPHTTSIKDYHVYVEGTYDVYIHQIFFKKFIDEISKQLKIKQGYADLAFSQILNRVEIYHLGGDFWEHLLHTIPQKPYNALLVFDGDKKTRVKGTVETYNHNRFGNLPSFKFTERIDFSHESYGDSIPVYTLTKKNIEQYLNPIPLPKAKAQGPDIAKEMTEIPNEFVAIYSEILKIIAPDKYLLVSSVDYLY